MSEDVQAAITRLWARSRPVVLERIDALQETAGELAAGRLEHQQVEEARADAHKLVGSLGTFGIPRGSDLARGVEHELEGGGGDPARLSDLLAELRAVVEATAE